MSYRTASYRSLILGVAFSGHPHLTTGTPLRVELQLLGSSPATLDASRGKPLQSPPGGTVPGDPILPDSTLTPGAAFPVSTKDICTPGYAKAVRHVTAKVKRQVYAAYGITTHQPGAYEIDHLVSLELGGSNAIRNLWPESYKTEPWNAHVKDAIENRLHSLVCAGKMPLEKAQREIASNWIAAYRKYFGRRLPIPRQTR